MKTIQTLVQDMNAARQRYAIDKNTLAWCNARIASADKAGDSWGMQINRDTRSMLFSNMNRHRAQLRKSIKRVESALKGAQA